MTVAVTCVTFSTLYSFTGGSDGSVPTGTLVQGKSDGNLYGTTFSGGSGTSVYDYSGRVGIGTVFRIGLAGNETVLYAFNGEDLPSLCEGGLTQGSDGNFYGAMTSSFGANYAGEQFQVTPAGIERPISPNMYRWMSGTSSDGHAALLSLAMATFMDGPRKMLFSVLIR